MEVWVVDVDKLELFGTSPAATPVAIDTVTVITFAGDADVDLIGLELVVGVELEVSGILVIAVVRARPGCPTSEHAASTYEKMTITGVVDRQRQRQY